MEASLSSNTYKQLHEEYMKNLNGTTAVETLLSVTPSVFSILLSTVYSLNYVRFYLQKECSLQHFVIEFVILISPLILGFTLMSDMIAVIHVTLAFVGMCVFYYEFTLQHIVNKNYFLKELLKSSMTNGKKPYITNFRAMTNLLSAICILAVDFKLFPRRFAKTESFGYSLMDIGVGLFSFSNAIIAPEALRSNYKRSESILRLYVRTLLSCIPLVALGGVRFFTTKQIDYQMHITEYGVHWNFFITLAVTKVLSTFILSLFNPKYCIILSLMVISSHEFMLAFGVQEWVLSDAPRNTFLSANREGIVSSFGYVALYIGAIGVGRFLKSDNTTFKDNLILTIKFICVAPFFWMFLLLIDNYFGTSRRLANIGYVLWVLTFCITTLPMYLVSELLIHSLRILHMYTKRSERKKLYVENTMIYVPIILEAVSYNGLAFFLIANLLTGMVNMCFQTLEVNSLCAVCIITCYTFVLCKIAVLLYSKGMKLKMW